MLPNLKINGSVLPVQNTQQGFGSQKNSGVKSGTSFNTILLQKTAEQQGVKFSRHALERIEKRGIEVSPEAVSKIAKGIDQVRAKGGNESLFMMGEVAFVVSAANKTVVTAMDKSGADPTIVTNIDSAIVL